MAVVASSNYTRGIQSDSRSSQRSKRRRRRSLGVDVARRRFELKAIIKEYELLRLTIKLRL